MEPEGAFLYDKLRHPVAFLVFLTTLLLPIGVGFFAARRTRSQSDFFLGGRTMNAFVVGLSAVSTGRSAWLVLGLSGIAYINGIGAVWAMVGYITVEAWQFFYLGKKLRHETQAQDSITLIDYFEARYRDKAKLLRITGVVIITIFITAYVAAQFNAGAKALSAALNFPTYGALLICGLLIMVYMVLGGYVAVAFNDVLRAIIMFAGLILLPLIMIFSVIGVQSFYQSLAGIESGFLDPWALGLGAIVGFVGIGLGSPGQPHIVVRYMSIRHEKDLKYSAIIGTFWNIAMGLGAISIGLIARVIFTDVNALPGNDPELVYLILSAQYLSPPLYGLLIGGVFAAILSTADSQLLVVASTFASDFYQKVLYPQKQISEHRKLYLGRIVVVIAGILAIILAYAAHDLIFWLVLFAWGGLGASFGPALILSLFWKKTTKYGAFAGMLSGAIVVIVWHLWLKDYTGIYELIPAFAVSLAIIVIISLITQPRTLIKG